MNNLLVIQFVAEKGSTFLRHIKKVQILVNQWIDLLGVLPKAHAEL